MTIFGTNFLNISSFTCRFGDSSSNSRVEAIYLSNSVAICFSPPAYRLLSASSVLLDISLNAIHFSSSSSYFTYRPAFKIYSIDPLHGPSSGGTLLTINGIGFPKLSFCLFILQTNSRDFLDGPSILSLRSNWIDQSTLTCVTPSHIAANVRVEIGTYNNSHSSYYESSSDGIAFTFLNTPIVNYLYPGSFLNEGGTVINVTGDYFDELLSNYFCLFSTVPITVKATSSLLASSNLSMITLPNYYKISPAKRYSSTSLDCVTPSFDFDYSVADHFPVYFEVLYSINSTTSSAVVIDIYPSVILKSVTPLMGPLTGYTRLTIIGERFANISSIECIFTRSQGESIRTEARYINSFMLICLSPSLYLSNSLTLEFVNITVTHVFNSKILSGSSLTFMFYPLPLLTSVTPSRGPMSGQTTLTVYGKNFLNVTSASCVFDTYSTPLTFLNESAVICSVPTLSNSFFSKYLLASFPFNTKQSQLISSPLLSDFLNISIDITFNGQQLSAVNLLELNNLTSINYEAQDIQMTSTFIDSYGLIGNAFYEFLHNRPLSFILDPLVFLSNINPAIGSIDGNITVSVYGNGFRGFATETGNLFVMVYCINDPCPLSSAFITSALTINETLFTFILPPAIQEGIPFSSFANNII